MPKAHSRAFALRVSGSTPEHVNQVCCRSSLLRPCARHAPPCTPRARARRTARREPCDSEERHGRGPRGRVLRRVRCPDSERATLLRTTNRVIRVWSCDDGVVGRRAIWAQRGAGRARAGRELGRREPGGAVRCERTGAGPGEAGGRSRAASGRGRAGTGWREAGMHRSDGIIRLNQKARWDILSYADFADIAFAYIVLCGFCGSLPSASESLHLITDATCLRRMI